MTENHNQLSYMLNKARELRITEGYGLFILVKVPALPEYRLINTSDPAQFRLWFEKATYQFVCIIDSLDILLIDSTIPFADLHQLFTECETLKPVDRTCLELADFLDLLKQRTNDKSSEIPN